MVDHTQLNVRKIMSNEIRIVLAADIFKKSQHPGFNNYQTYRITNNTMDEPIVPKFSPNVVAQIFISQKLLKAAY